MTDENTQNDEEDTHYPLMTPASRWQEFKGTVSHNETLNDRLQELIRARIQASYSLDMSVPGAVETLAAAERFERTADDRGRVKLPSKYGDEGVTVYVIEEEDDD